MKAIYLDCNATTPLDPRVGQAMADCERLGPLNPASQHSWGRQARRMMEDAREGIAAILGAGLAGPQPDRLLFTSGGTEANNLALLGLSGPQPARILVSSLEHPSVVGPAEALARRGHEVQRIRALASGRIDCEHAQTLLAGGAKLVSLMLGNNETGVLQPVAAVAAAARAAGALVHCDAVQAVGKIAVNFQELGVDALTASAHKLHGPRGIRALLLRSGVPLVPMFLGGFQQEGLRPGTESVALAVGFHQALLLWREEQAIRTARLSALRDAFEARLRHELPDIVVHGQAAERLPHTSGIAFLGLDRQALLMALDLAGVAASAGSACASGSSEPSPVLLAMGCESAVVRGSLRFSFGATTTAAEVEQATDRILKAVKELRRSI